MLDIRQGICPLCSHNEIIQAAAVDFMNEYQRAAMSVAQVVKPLSLPVPLGILNLWTCRRCGFTQWFAFNPESIPIGDEHSTRLVRGSEPAGPYR